MEIPPTLVIIDDPAVSEGFDRGLEVMREVLMAPHRRLASDNFEQARKQTQALMAIRRFRMIERVRQGIKPPSFRTLLSISSCMSAPSLNGF